MGETIKAQIEKLRASIEGLEAQRSLLGDAVVQPALAALRSQLEELEKQSASPAPPYEERRLVTILFMDMVGSTSMAEKLDPEEWRQIVGKMHAVLGKTITTHHGEVAQYLGDGLLAFFGAKEASERDPENAIRAALDGQSSVAGLLSGEKVQLRAGIHTGLVVVGELGGEFHKEFTASGDAVNLAARLQSAAAPGGVLISHDTYRYVRGVFDLTPRPPLTVKGKSEPILTYQVRRAKPRPFRSVARGVAGVETRTIGRETETQALQAAYLRAFEGHGIVWAQLLGEPGIGKSRLLQDLNDWIDLRQETCLLLRARAFQDDLNQPFALVRRLWFDRFQIADDAPLALAEAKWAGRFKELYGQGDSEESAHSLGLLVGLPFENSLHIKAMRSYPDQVKGRAVVVSRELINSARLQNPVVVLLEDLQWVDPASWEYLVEVFLGESALEPTDERTAQALNGLFVLAAARPEWRPPPDLESFLAAPLSAGNETAEPGLDRAGIDKSSLLIQVKPLPDQASRELALEIFQRVENIPEQVIELLVERSEGVPYYAEEIVNWFIDRGILDTTKETWLFLPEKLKDEPFPATLQHLLLTRLSNLSDSERAALQRGAIFGRRFWTGGVEALGVEDGAVTLGQLQPRGFVEVQPDSAFQDDTEWSFHQSILQEVTYESVLKRERAALHRVAAGWLETQARQAGRADEFAGLLGDHFERAGELSTAADWYIRAGKGAMAQGSPLEASRFYSQALELLPPVDRDRRWQALLGREEAHGVLGDSDPWREDVSTLLELAISFDDDRYLAEIYLRQALFELRAGDERISYQASLDALAAARRCENVAIEAKALALLTVTDVNRGDKSNAVDHIELALQLSRRHEDDNVLAFVLFRAAYGYGGLGDISRAYSLQVEQVELDHRLGNRSHEAIGLNNLGGGYNSIGLYKQARVVLDQARMINTALGARRALAYNLIGLGQIGLELGDLRTAHQLTEQALQAIAPSQDMRGKIFILNAMGAVLFAMGDYPGASRRHTEARQLAESQQLRSLETECLAGLAACAIMLGKLDDAAEYIGRVWDELKVHGWVGIPSPERVYRICAETFDSLGDSENFRAVIESAYNLLMEVAESTNAPEFRQSYLENVRDNRAIMEMWERSKF